MESANSDGLFEMHLAKSLFSIVIPKITVIMAFTAYVFLTGFVKHNVLHTMIKNLTNMYPWYEIASFGKKEL